MNEERFTIRCTVYILFIKENKILLYRRINTGWQDGKYNVPGGHLEDGESVLEACVREAKEETGIEISENDLELVHVMHRYHQPDISIETNKDVIDLFFKVKNWEGEPRITEEEKSDEMIWAGLDQLPENLLLFEQHALTQIKNKSMFSDFSG